MQIIHSVDDDTHRWLKAAADADGCGVGEIVRRCIAYAREASESVSAAPDEANLRAQEQRARQEVEARIRQHEAAVVQKRRELAALLGEELTDGRPIGTRAHEAMHAAGEVERLLDQRAFQTAHYIQEMAVIDPTGGLPPLEDVDLPADPDDGYAPQPLPANLRAPQSMLDAASRRPGMLTRPRGVNPAMAVGTQQGDGGGNVLRTNFEHLGFTTGRPA